MKQEKIYIYGKHALFEALSSSPQSISKVFLANKDLEIEELAKKNNIKVHPLGQNKNFDEIKKESHQGVIGVVSLEKLVRPYKDFVDNFKTNKNTSLVLLAGIQDPHNVGAIIRSAVAFGVGAVLLPEHNQAPITGAVVKVSAGMVFKIPIVSIGNVNTTIKDLKDRGFWIYGLDAGGSVSVNDEKYDEPSVFVMGNESKGLREKTNEACDTILSIPIDKKCESLNVATAAAVTFYSWSLQHPPLS
jgi:23S rRNA (guanosine2251-2'-O)-methyltransferase